MATDTTKRALNKLADRLAAARRKLDISQADMAKRLRLKHQSGVAKIEGHERELHLADFVRWARAVDADPCELLEEFERDLKVPRQPWPD